MHFFDAWHGRSQSAADAARASDLGLDTIPGTGFGVYPLIFTGCSPDGLGFRFAQPALIRGGVVYLPHGVTLGQIEFDLADNPRIGEAGCRPARRSEYAQYHLVDGKEVAASLLVESAGLDQGTGPDTGLGGPG